MDERQSTETSVLTFEGVVEQGQIRLNAGIYLPEGTQVYVVVPGRQAQRVVRSMSPRLVRPEQAADFVMKVSEDVDSADV